MITLSVYSTPELRNVYKVYAGHYSARGFERWRGQASCWLLLRCDAALYPFVVQALGAGVVIKLATWRTGQRLALVGLPKSNGVHAHSNVSAADLAV